MTPRPQNLTTRQIISALERDDFRRTHQTGSHVTYRRGDRRVMVAVHSPGANIPAGTLRRIIIDAGWTAEDLRRLRLVR